MKYGSDNDSRPASHENRGRDETRARILIAARDCFSRTGFERTTVKNIAAACGLSDASIYYYFPSKRHLLEALWTVRPNRGIRGIPATTPLTADRLRALNDATLDFLADNHQLMRLTSRAALDGDEVARALRNDTRATWRDSLHRHLSTVAGGEAVSHTADLLMAYLTGATMKAHMELGDAFDEAARTEGFRAEIHQNCLLLTDLPLATSI
jgi:AcrR family transcriptional regulator